MKDEIAIILTSLASEESAKSMAATLVESGLAACVQISSPGISVYRWDNTIQQEQELYLSIKTTNEASAAVCNWLEKNHPYETPEIIRLTGASRAAYLQWLRESVQ